MLVCDSVDKVVPAIIIQEVYKSESRPNANYSAYLMFDKNRLHANTSVYYCSLFSICHVQFGLGLSMTQFSEGLQRGCSLTWFEVRQRVNAGPGVLRWGAEDLKRQQEWRGQSERVER